LPLPKGKKRGGAVGYCGEEPVAWVAGAGSSTPPIRWIQGKLTPFGFQDVKKLAANGTSTNQIAGRWNTPKGDEHALVWTRQSDGGLDCIELQPDKWEKSNALACGGGQQVGYG